MKFLTLCIALLGSIWVQEVAAQSLNITSEKKKLFVVSVNKKFNTPRVYGSFCKAEGKTLDGCLPRRRGASTFLPYPTYSEQKSRDTGPYSFFMMYGKFKKPSGRYYLTSGSEGQTINIKDVTYYGDFAPGTVVVYNLDGIPSKAAMETAKAFLVRVAGQKMANLKYVLGGATSLKCQKVNENCQIGKPIPIERVKAQRFFGS